MDPMDMRIKMSAPVSLKMPMKMALAMHKARAKKTNPERKAEAVVRTCHPVSVFLSALCEACEPDSGCPTTCPVSSLSCFLEPILPFLLGSAPLTARRCSSLICRVLRCVLLLPLWTASAFSVWVFWCYQWSSAAPQLHEHKELRCSVS